MEYHQAVGGRDAVAELGLGRSGAVPAAVELSQRGNRLDSRSGPFVARRISGRHPAGAETPTAGRAPERGFFSAGKISGELDRRDLEDWAAVAAAVWKQVQRGEIIPPVYDFIFIDEAQFFA